MLGEKGRAGQIDPGHRHQRDQPGQLGAFLLGGLNGIGFLGFGGTVGNGLLHGAKPPLSVWRIAASDIGTSGDGIRQI